MTMRSRKTGDKIVLDGENLLPESKRNQRRWRMAYTAIYFTRLLGSLSKTALESRTKILRSLSYVALDVRDDTPRENLVSLINVDQRTLADMVKGKNLESLKQLGGVTQVATTILETDVKNGAKEAGVAHRRDVFGANRFKKTPEKSFLRFVVEELKDMTIIILFGLCYHVSGICNFKQSKQFEKLSDESNNINVQVVRDGRHHHLSIFDVVVGDVVSLKIGDQIPADGMFLNGYSLKVDESSMTGESDDVEVNGKNNPFLLSGTKVTDGFGFMVVTSVGMNTAWGEMMGSICHDLDEQTPLQARLNKLTSSIGKVGLTVAVLVLAVLMIRYFTGNTIDDNGRKEYTGSQTKFSDVLDSVVGIIAAAVTIVVVAIPEGLPLAVTLTLAYSMKRMMKDNAMVRKLSACETMGSATIICTDKTGTLTLNQMKVTEFWLGKETIDDDSLTEIESEVYQLLQEGVALNTTGTVNKSHATLVPEITGSPTEKAILSWALLDLGMNINETKEKYPCRPGVRTAVESCKNAGVNVKMITGDNVHTARAIAIECGILSPEQDMENGAVVEGVQFRNYSPEERMAMIDNIQVMARSSPFDKLLMKFIQFQLTVNVAALAINFVAAISSGKVPLTAVQLLWVNLIMDTLGALALATEQPTNDLMARTPVGRSEPLITKIMWRNLLAQALYQVSILLTLQFKGKAIFGVDEKIKNTLIFNTFVLCQAFNEFNARKLEKKNIFKGIHKNKLFFGNHWSYNNSSSDHGGASEEVCQH
ncbi:hypothetical protein H0E87_009988 [Populus deltoides]|uniref:Calcium-transporting ATPase n=1 Tax=Populus deltoides TaxID=3696 RepID=A0A8T2YR68_POPDE|nr:hypothetical protein H0E87_009988 [Populus deltoides]